MADAVDEWTTNATDAFTISLMQPQPDGLKLIDKFNPRFTYSIFGEDEMIYGYKNLHIQLFYRANDMRPNLKVTYSKRLDAIGDIEIPDVRAVLEGEGHLPKIAFVKASDFEESSKQCVDGWTPPGVLHKSFQAGSERYEIWKGSLSLAAVKQLVNRVQILVPLFIEGGSYIIKDDNTPEDDNRWTVFLMFRKETSGAYTFVGYSTVYRFFYFQTSDQSHTEQKLDLDLEKNDNFDLTSRPTRSRLSQLIILPPFQGKGNGRRLYETIFEYYHKQQPQTLELTIEDPNEEFDDLRDLADLTFLRKVPEFQSLHINAAADLASKDGLLPLDLVTGIEPVEMVRKKSKMARRQFNRVLEMHLMSKLPASLQPKIDAEPTKKDVKATSEEHLQYRVWQLLVKSRLYKQHKDTLNQLELDVRHDKLEETLRNVEFEFARLLAMHEKWTRHDGSPEDGGGKRKLSHDLDDDDEDRGSVKKAKVDDEAIQD